MKTNHPEVKILEYSYITDGIYIGTNKCCQIHFDEKLLNEGIEVDFSLEENQLDSPFGIKFYIWLPVKDDKAPTPQQLEFGVSALEKFVTMKKKIYVHCQNGHGRATILVAGYLVKKGKSVKEALEFIKRKRPSIHLEEVQKQALEEFSKNTN